MTDVITLYGAWCRVNGVAPEGVKKRHGASFLKHGAFSFTDFGSCSLLPLTIPFHTWLMRPLSQKFDDVLLCGTGGATDVPRRYIPR